MAYVDGFVIPIPEKNLPAYRRMAQKAGKVWMELGALEYRECVGDDLEIEGTTPFSMTPFSKALKLKAGETVVFSWIVYKSKAHRDRVNASVLKDPRMAQMQGKSMPFDVKRMLYGGFRVLVDL